MFADLLVSPVAVLYGDGGGSSAALQLSPAVLAICLLDRDSRRV